MLGSNEAKAIHAEHPAIDLHADTLMWARWVNYDLHKRHEPPLPKAAIGGHVDLPRMREGGMGAQFFGLVSLPVARHSHGLARVIDEQIDALEAATLRDPAALKIVTRASEIEACKKEGSIAALLGIEGAHALEGDVDRISAFAKRGVRYLGISHFTANHAAFPAYGRGMNDAEGLTPFGRKLVAKCEEVDVLVDLAHINRKGFLDACAMAQKPPIVSHTGVLGVHEHWRNIGDDQLRAVAEKGGVVGVIFCPKFLGGDGLGPVVEHMKHILDVVGEDVPALGSDWDGFIVPTGDLKDPLGLPLLTDALLQAGISARVVGKILRENVLRVLA